VSGNTSEPQETKEQREDRVIGALCSVMEKVEGHRVRVISNPDRANRGRPGCDAILSRGNRQCAVEHEIVESFRGQKEDDARFREVILPVESALASAFPEDDVSVVVPVGAIPSKTQWTAISRGLADGLIRELPGLPYNTPRNLALDGVPFRTIAVRRRPFGTPSATIFRLAPPVELIDITRDPLRMQLTNYGPPRTAVSKRLSSLIRKMWRW